MTLQNRSDPAGNLNAVPSRGMFTGNRGIIHDPDSRALLNRRWTTKSWIICSCEWKGRKRIPMGRNRPGGKTGWTELFFLDEVTALAAGHRPCFVCRRQNAVLFAEAFAAGNGLADTKVVKIDKLLHRERALSGRARPYVIDPDEITRLPSGTIVDADGDFLAVRNGIVLPWSFEGYLAARDPRELRSREVILVTPRATLAALDTGYRPVWHESAVSGFPVRA
jgi:hypothetical protein